MSAHEGVAEPGGRDKGRSSESDASLAAAAPIRLAYLDGLRAIAAGYVVLFHAVPGFSAASLTGPLRILKRVFAYGHEAVAIFIVLSGYCLMLPVLRKDPAGLSVAFGRFLKRRARRILPPYFAALVFSLALLAGVSLLRKTSTGTIWDDSLPGLDGRAVVTHLLVVHNWFPSYGYQINGPLWSVASEWQIYFFFPLVLLPVWRRFGMLATLLAAAVIGYAPLLFASAPAHVAIPWYLLLFGFGMAAASIGFSSERLATHLRGAVPWPVVSLGLWLLCVALSNGAATLWFRFKPLADPLIGLATAALLVHLSAAALARAPSRLLALLQSKPLVALGHFSYSLYLTHLPVLALCFFGLRSLGASAGQLLVATSLLGSVVSLLVAYGFHLAVERPFMRH